MTGRRRGAIYCSRTCKTAASDRRRRDDGRAHARDHARYPGEADHRRTYARDHAAVLRVEVRSHFGLACVSCAATETLELDHVHGNGELHRDLVGHGDAFFRWLRRNGYPAECASGGEFELQVLCRGCHAEKTKRERG